MCSCFSFYLYLDSNCPMCGSLTGTAHCNASQSNNMVSKIANKQGCPYLFFFFSLTHQLLHDNILFDFSNRMKERLRNQQLQDSFDHSVWTWSRVTFIFQKQTDLWIIVLQVLGSTQVIAECFKPLGGKFRDNTLLRPPYGWIFYTLCCC